MQLRSFVFTWNNYPENAKELLVNYFHDCRYMIIGYEVAPTTGCPHLQGFIQLKTRVTFNKLAQLFPWHIEKTAGTPVQASEYCKKTSNFEEFGSLCESKQGAQLAQKKWEDILGMAQQGQMEELAQQFPGEYLRHFGNLHRVRVEAMASSCNVKLCVWLHGKPGTGKSRFVFDYDQSCYYKNPNKWWDNYRGQKCVCIDDLGKEHSVLGYHIKRWSDRYPCLCEAKGSSLYPDYDVLFVTSNYKIEEVFTDSEMISAIKRRFREIEVFGFEESLEGILSIKTSSSNNLYNYKLINKFNLCSTD